MQNATLNHILIMVADDDEKQRGFVAGVLETFGFRVLQAINGGAAIKVIEEWDVDVAVIADRLKPNDGFEVAKHIVVKGYNTGVVMLTDDPSTDLLLQAGQNGIGMVMKKPVDPDRLLQTIKRMVRLRGKNPDALGSEKEGAFSSEDLMKRVVALASQNARARLGGPFAAIVADKNGRILGEGVNSVYTRCDPSAHAEVLAIRRATEKIGKPRLDGCVIYTSSEPTMLGQALIIGTGIEKVYYGVSHAEAGTPHLEEEGILGEIAKPLAQRSVAYQQIGREDALAVIRDWQAMQARDKNQKTG